MKDKIKKYLKEVIVFVIVLTVATNAISYYQSRDLNKDKLDITDFSLLDGNSYTLPNDKPVLVHFWATWCPTCKFESPNIEKVSKKYEVITIAVQSGSKKNIQNYLLEHNLNFKVVEDKDGFYATKI